MRHRAQKSTTGPERRKERETFCIRFGKWTRFLRWRTQLHENDSQCESFFYLYSLIRSYRITSDEENINKLLSDVREKSCKILHSAKFWTALSNSFEFSYFNFTQKNFYHYNVYIIMMFLNFILKYDDTNIFKGF